VANEICLALLSGAFYDNDEINSRGVPFGQGSAEFAQNVI